MSLLSLPGSTKWVLWSSEMFCRISCQWRNQSDNSTDGGPVTREGKPIPGIHVSPIKTNLPLWGWKRSKIIYLPGRDLKNISKHSANIVRDRVMTIKNYKTLLIAQLTSCKEELITWAWGFREVEVYELLIVQYFWWNEHLCGGKWNLLYFHTWCWEFINTEGFRI